MSATVEAGRPAPERGKQIVVLEDDEDILESVAAVLQSAGFNVDPYSNGHEALRHLRESPVDLVLLDLMMPVMDGWEFRAAQRADQSIAAVPVVVMTADTSAKAAAIHADGYLRKPFGANELLTTIDRVLLAQDRRRLAATLEETGRLALLGTIAAGVGHEINNPLSFAMANLELLERTLTGFDTHDFANDADKLTRLTLGLTNLNESARDMRTGLERVRLVVRNLQSLSRRSDDERVLVDVFRVLDSSISMASSHIKYRARLTKEYEALPEVWANEGRLGQVFLNLLVNAAQSIPIGEVSANEIHVGARRKGDWAVIEFKDSGQGMSNALLARIFEPFFTTKGQGQGTGLGLPICRDIVEGYGGRIEVDSEVGRGSVFRVLLPIQTSGERRAIATEVASRHDAGARPTLEKSARPRVWVVDDEKLVADVIGRILRSECDISLCDSPDQVLSRLEFGEAFDVMLCDVMMPEMSGVELCKRIAAKWPSLAERIVFMSGGTLAPSIAEFVKRPERLFLEKPFDADSLKATVARAASNRN
jgi:signal transduction histidine kinase